MSDHAQARAWQQSGNLARHLNGQHPETVLLLARHAPGGRPDVIAAELTGADEGGLTIAAATASGPTELRLTLPEGSDIRSRVAALLMQTRAGLPDDVPLTSLEQQMAGGHPRGRSDGT